MKYVQFSNMPMKARIGWIQEKLIKFGYLKQEDCTPNKRDKKYIKALMKYQESQGITPNADITEMLFNALNYN